MYLDITYKILMNNPYGQEIEWYSKAYKQIAQDSIIENHHTNSLPKCVMVNQNTINEAIDEYVNKAKTITLLRGEKIYTFLHEMDNYVFDLEPVNEEVNAILVDFMNYFQPQYWLDVENNTSDFR